MSRSKQPIMIEHAILGFLRERPLHGYELHQRLIASDALGAIWPLKQGQLYAMVGRLEDEGYLTVAVEQRGSLPPRKLLQLTSAGMAAFTTWLHTSSEPGEEAQRGFLARLYFARQLGPATTRCLLLYERNQRQSQLQSLRGQIRAQPAQSYPWLVSQWQLAQAEAAISWIDAIGIPPVPGVAYPIAVLADSPAADLARHVMAYICGPAGQAVLARFGFLPASQPAGMIGEQAGAASLRGRLVIYAASSLTAAFEVLGDALRAAHPAISLHVVFGGSHDLASRLGAGAACDIYAPAHHDAMDAVIAAGRVSADAVATLVYNQIAIVTPAHGQALVHSLGDLARPGLRLALGSGTTAIGRYTQDMLAAATFDGALASDGPAAVLHNVVYYGETVTGVLAKVAQGEVDAGVVFSSDFYRADGAVTVAAVPASEQDHR